MPLHRSLPKNDTLSTPAELLAQTDYRHLVPLLKLRDQVLEIHKKWAVVQHVIMYLDATNNAKTIRWLLPAIKTLKGAEAIPDEIDPRVAPPSMGVMLPLVREAGVTLSAAQFLPKAEPRPLGKLIFYCTDTTAFPHNNVKVVPPLATYEL